MAYAVELSKNTQEFLEKLDKHIKDRIETRLAKLKFGPIPSDAKFICRDDGEAVFRYRIGDFRALYKVKHKEKMVLITKIDKRPRAYHR